MITHVKPIWSSAYMGLLFLLLTPTFTSAECLKDRYGEVYCGAGRCLMNSHGTVFCSQYYDGDVKRTSRGKIVCGQGDCEKLTSGKIYCSTEIGGTVLIDSKGRARCQGDCELASEEMCETTVAGSSNY